MIIQSLLMEWDNFKDVNFHYIFVGYATKISKGYGW